MRVRWRRRAMRVKMQGRDEEETQRARFDGRPGSAWPRRGLRDTQSPHTASTSPRRRRAPIRQSSSRAHARSWPSTGGLLRPIGTRSAALRCGAVQVDFRELCCSVSLRACGLSCARPLGPSGSRSEPERPRRRCRLDALNLDRRRLGTPERASLVTMSAWAEPSSADPRARVGLAASVGEL